MKGTLIEGCPDLITPVYEAKKRKIQNYPYHTNRASEAGHPCERYLVFSRTKWEEKLMYETEAQFIFEGGHMIEEMAITDLKEAGFQILEQNRAFSWRAFELTGHMDLKIGVGDSVGAGTGKTFPIEVKGLNQFDFDKLNCIEDFMLSPKPWIKKYPAQLVLYMLMANIEYGAFYLKRIPGFKPKQIWVSLDYTFAEDILKKLERVNRHVKDGTEPEPLAEPDICKWCGFLHICLPSMKGKEIEILDMEEVEDALKRCQELEPAYKEYQRADKAWKAALKGKEKVIVGDFLVTGEEKTRKGFTVEPSTYWQSKVIMKPGKTVPASEN